MGCKISKRRKARAGAGAWSCKLEEGFPSLYIEHEACTHPYPVFTRRIHHRFVTASLHPGPNSLISQSRLQVETCIVLTVFCSHCREPCNHVLPSQQAIPDQCFIVIPTYPRSVVKLSQSLPGSRCRGGLSESDV
jgi:hypothetical protein